MAVSFQSSICFYSSLTVIFVSLFLVTVSFYFSLCFCIHHDEMGTVSHYFFLFCLRLCLSSFSSLLLIRTGGWGVREGGRQGGGEAGGGGGWNGGTIAITFSVCVSLLNHGTGSHVLTSVNGTG